ncbi:MAG TPA: enolase C-terminal domain-like protein [Gaiella sp.]|nr:enolase C-terminal domain-like protein [Gaiella sp.]
MTVASRARTAIRQIEVGAYTVPTDEPESDGTLEWDSTTIVVVQCRAGDEVGLGYTYGDVSTARLVDSVLADVALDRDALAVTAAWDAMTVRLRNAGRPGIGSMALAAVDIALWDLKARLLELPLAALLDARHAAVPVYGSGGFTSYTNERLAEQLAGWVAEGIPRVKMKLGRRPEDDPARLDAAREAIGPETELFVDANGAYGRKQALAWAERLRAEWDVTWLEEPVSSNDLEGLRLVRDRAPAGLEVAAGEYGYRLADFRGLLAAEAVDCLQADVTRCGGITGLLAVGALADAHELDVSGHTAPAVSAHAFAALRRTRHLEYFHDHVRIESLLFDGTLVPEDGALRPDPSRPGLGIELKQADAEPFRTYG